MNAIIVTGGKQYKVAEGDVVYEMRISLLHGIVETYPAANQMDERAEYADTL